MVQKNIVETRCMADIAPQQIQWLWRPYIPIGKITLLLGDPGQGKTMLSLAIASLISTGSAFLGDEDLAGPRSPAPVLYQTAEDGIADTIRPRLDKLGADITRIHFIDEETKGLSLSDNRIEQALRQILPVLMIIDPLQAYLGADVDMHRANQVRPILSQIGNLAEKYRCAVIFIMHMSKMSQGKALYRGLGSIDIPAVSRSMLVVGENPNQPEQKIIAHEKSSLAPQGTSIAFHIDSERGVVFEGYSDLTADQLLAPAKDTAKARGASLPRATVFLEAQLSLNRYARLIDIRAAAQAQGISERTLQRAKEKLKLVKYAEGFSPKITWWAYPDMKKEDISQTEKRCAIEVAGQKRKGVLTTENHAY